MTDTTTTTTSAPTTAPVQTSPAPDGSGALDAAADAVVVADEADASAEQPNDELKSARVQRDAAKKARRAAEERADALATRVAELETQAAEVTRLRGELKTLHDANRQQRTRAIIDEIEQAMSPHMRGAHVAPLVTAFAAANAIDLGAPDASAMLMTKLRAHSPALFVTPSSSHQSPPGFPAVI